MAKRKQRAVSSKRDAEPAEGVTTTELPAGKDDGGEHVVVVVAATEVIGFRLRDVVEIIRFPRLAHMPLGPRSLLGLANLRGAVLPVVSLRRLLSLPDAPLDDAARVIVIDRGAPVGFVVDRIESLDTIALEAIEKGSAGAGRLDPGLLDGFVKGKEGESGIKLLNPDRLLREEFSKLQIAGRRETATVTFAAESGAQAVETKKVSLVSFDLGTQEYALPLERVREIITAPEHMSEVAGAETAVLGVVTLRDRLLPLVSLRALLGLPPDGDNAERGKVVVLSMGKANVGVVTDRTREILRIDPNFIDPAPALLTRGAGDAEITSICRLENGKRIVAVLSPDRLFRSDLVSRVLADAGGDSGETGEEMAENVMSDEQFIIFRLGDQEYGLPIAAVDEVARPPDQITRLPKAPAFIDGVINLRGSVVPIVDLRRRFELPSQEQGPARRILVVSLGAGQTGFMVDQVSEVLKVHADAIRPSPDLSSEQMRLIGRVVNLEEQGRMILLLDPEQLLDQVESEVLAKFDRTKSLKALNAS
jgi:purine-binding chemotaxis protein CheW